MATAFDWNLLKSFLAVYETGSLSGAARRLGASQPTLGRHIKELEQALNLQLFIRHPHGFEATENGRELARRAQAVGATIADFTRGAAGLMEQLAGTIRVTASEPIAYHILPNAIRPLREKEPEVEIELIVDNAIRNLSRQEADIALRQSVPTEEDLIAQRVGTLELGLYASQAFLHRLGPPNLTSIIEGRHLIGSNHAPLPPHVADQIPVDISRRSFWFRSDSFLAQRAMMRAGLGIGSELVLIAEQEPELVRLLPTLDIPPQELWLVAHRDMMNSRLVRTVYRLLATSLRDACRSPT